MQLFENTVKLRGFLGEDARTPDSNHVHWESIAILTLCIGSGIWRKAHNEWAPHTDSLEIHCRGPYFCGLTRGMKQGTYLEIEAELHITTVVHTTDPTNPHRACEIRATQIRRLEMPLVGVDEQINEDDD